MTPVGRNRGSIPLYWNLLKFSNPIEIISIYWNYWNWNYQPRWGVSGNFRQRSFREISREFRDDRELQHGLVKWENKILVYGLHKNNPTTMSNSPVEFLRKCNFTQFTRVFPQSFIWIDGFQKFCCDINKYNIRLVIVYFREYTWPVTFERTHLQGLTHSRRWDIWIDVHVVFRWFQPYTRYLYPTDIDIPKLAKV